MARSGFSHAHHDALPIIDLPDSRTRLLMRQRGLSVKLTHYEKACVQDRHTHDVSQTSFLLLGGLLERHGSREYEARSGWVGHKPAGWQHANDFGAGGALLLTLETDDAAQPDLQRHGWQPSPIDFASIRRMVDLALQPGDSGIEIDAVGDLLALGNDAAGLSKANPSPSLTRARQELDEIPEHCRIDALARRHGFRRTHFARAFKQHFGDPPSVYRARAMTWKATRELLQGTYCSVAEVAHGAGFADHSHYCRMLRRFSGLSPMRLQALFEAHLFKPSADYLA